MEIEWKKLKKRFIASFIILATITFVIWLVIVIGRNPLGDFFGYPRCPNCEDSVWLNEEACIPYHLTNHYNKGRIIYAEITTEVRICKECLAKTAELDEEIIEQNLLANGWSAEATNSVKEAVIRYKKEKLKNRE